MKDPRREYEAALADFSQPGGRWNAKGRLTYWGKAAGMSADEIISDAWAAGVRDRDADIRRGWNDATALLDLATASGLIVCVECGGKDGTLCGLPEVMQKWREQTLPGLDAGDKTEPPAKRKRGAR